MLNTAVLWLFVRAVLHQLGIGDFYLFMFLKKNRTSYTHISLNVLINYLQKQVDLTAIRNT